MTEEESVQVRQQLRNSHPDIEFAFHADLGASAAVVAVTPPEDQPEAEIDRVALLFLGRRIETELAALIREQRERLISSEFDDEKAGRSPRSARGL